MSLVIGQLSHSCAAVRRCQEKSPTTGDEHLLVYRSITALVLYVSSKSLSTCTYVRAGMFTLSYIMDI
jgi:hypothetical protein